MSKKTVLFEAEEKKLCYDAAVLLRKLGDQLAQGYLEFPGQSGAVRIDAPKDVMIEIDAKEKVKSKGTKFGLEISLEWYTAPQPGCDED
ncbi:MAG: amphi-Trp domain-containing protein [Desulfovibrionaceae bacterium]|jgi:amphi-Trp domain-containing protein